MPDDTAVITAPDTSAAPTTSDTSSAAASSSPASPAIAAPSTPSTPSTPATPRDPEQALREAVGKQMDKVPGFEVTKKPAVAETKTPEQLAAEKTAADKAAADAAAANKTPEQKAAADKAAADKATADKAAAEAKGQPNPLDKLGPLPVETIAKAITENPELASALEKAGIDSELLYETSRRAALTDQFTEVFPTPDAAKFAGESAQHFYDIEEGFPQIQSVEDFDKFLTGTMLPLSVLYDTEGKPLMNADGKGYQTDGSIGRFMNAAAQFETIGSVSAIDRLIGEYSKLQSDEGKEMLAEAQRIREAIVEAQNFRDAGYRLPGQKPAATQRSPEDQALFDKLQRENAEAAKVKTDAAQKEDQAYQSSVIDAAVAEVEPWVKSVLERSTGLTDNDKRNIAKEVREETWVALGKNRHYQMQKEHLYTLGNSTENKQAIVGLARTTFEVHAAKLLQAKILEYGGKQISRQQSKLDKITTQTTNDRMNQGTGTTAGAKPAAVSTPAEIRAQAVKNLQARNKGAMPDDGEILAETMAIRGLRSA